MNKNKNKIYEFVVVAFLTFISFFVYYQVSMYPYKVDRWLQPYEAYLIGAIAKQCSPQFSWLNGIPDYAVSERGAYSVQVAFLSADKKSETCSLGYKDKLFGVQLSNEHRYRYASITKLITVAAVMRLKSQKKIDLDDKMIDFFPELTEFKDERIRKISVANLLNHSAGFNRLTFKGDPMFLRSNKPWCPSNLSKLQDLILSFNPSEKQVYSNEAYCLLGEIIHRVTGESFRSYIKKEFSLDQRNIKFAESYYYDDEVRYDYRYEEWYNDSYLTLFDFDSIASSAGMSGSASALAGLLWHIHHQQDPSPFSPRFPIKNCDFHEKINCSSFGVFQYQPEKNSMVLYYHEGYLPGSSSIAVIDSYGGVTVILRSGSDKLPQTTDNQWISWIYRQLNLHYIMQGKLPILQSMQTH